jgi:hypothetical protein
MTSYCKAVSGLLSKEEYDGNIINLTKVCPIDFLSYFSV